MRIETPSCPVIGYRRERTFINSAFLLRGAEKGRRDGQIVVLRSALNDWDSDTTLARHAGNLKNLSNEDLSRCRVIVCSNPSASMLGIKRFKKTLSGTFTKEGHSLDPRFKTPLTERNIETFTVEQQDEDARNQVRRSREVQISEWIRLLPRVSLTMLSPWSGLR